MIKLFDVVWIENDCMYAHIYYNFTKKRWLYERYEDERFVKIFKSYSGYDIIRINGDLW